MSLLQPGNIVTAVLAAVLGLLAGPRVTWAIRAWPGHEAFDSRYLKCSTCAGGLRRGCYNAGVAQDYVFATVTMLLAFLSVWYYGVGSKAIFSWIFATACLIITVVDYRYLIIPDKLSINGFYIGLLYHGVIALWISYGGGTPPEYYLPFRDSLFGFLLGGGFLWALRAGAWIILKKEGMGGGDIKLLATMGAWLGYQPVVGIIIVASMLGTIGGIGQILVNRLIYGKKYRPFSHMIPFGPYLCLGFLLIFYAGMEPLWWLMEQYQRWLEAHLMR
ncbi:MAG TPA: A24 family peptidase [Candidatus Ozemobacteraceae bacterium]|nr:A24 family peptidase [Candidatus Ozemobacteraceae bacterium]